MDKARFDKARAGLRQRRQFDIAWRVTHKRDTTQGDREKADAKPQVNPRDNPPGLKNAGGA